MADKTQISNSKNVVGENISNAENVHVGDNITNINNFNQNKTHQIPKEITLRIPKLRADQIVGRREDLADLKNRLFDNKQVVVVNGMGGIGKTTLAQVYLSENWEAYQHIAWIPMLSGKLEDDLIQADGILKAFNISTQNKLPVDLFREVIFALKNIGKKPCLLVLDNATNQLSKYFELLPSQPNWHILATSRQTIEHFDLKDLGFLTEAEAIELFRQHYTLAKLDEDFLKELVASVDYHTLTIEILAKTAQRQRTSPEKLMKALQEDLPADIKIRYHDNKIERVFSFLKSIFKISKLAENEHWLLQNMICLPAEFHLFEDLEKLIQPKISERETIFSGLLEDLVEKGWVLKNKEKDAYKIHRVIGEVVARSLEMREEKVEGLIDSVTGLLFFDGAKDNPADKFEWIPFGEAILEYFGESKETNIATLQNNLGLSSKNLGNFKKAKLFLTQAMQSYENNLGKSHSYTAISYSNLAGVLKALGDYEGAKALLEKSLKICEESFGEKHPETAIHYSNLGLVLQALGDYESVKALLEKSLKICEENFGEKHPNTAVSYSNLALVLQDLGDYEGAKALLEKAVKSADANFGEKHPTTAVRYSNLGLVLQDLGDYEGAKALLEKAVKSDEANFGEKHPTTAVRYSNLATVLQDLGEFKKAEILYKKSLAVFENLFGKEHPNTKTVQRNLDYLLKLMQEK